MTRWQPGRRRAAPQQPGALTAGLGTCYSSAAPCRVSTPHPQASPGGPLQAGNRKHVLPQQPLCRTPAGGRGRRAPAPRGRQQPCPCAAGQTRHTCEEAMRRRGSTPSARARTDTVPEGELGAEQNRGGWQGAPHVRSDKRARAAAKLVGGQVTSNRWTARDHGLTPRAPRARGAAGAPPRPPHRPAP